MNSTDCNVDYNYVYLDWSLWSFLNIRWIIIQIFRWHFNYNLLYDQMLYHNISPFCEPLSFAHQRITFQLDLFLCFAIWIFFVYFHTDLCFIRTFYCFFLWISIWICVLYELLHCIFVWISIWICVLYELLHCTFVWISIWIFAFTLVISYEFSPLFLPQIDYHVFYIVLHLYTNFLLLIWCGFFLSSLC